MNELIDGRWETGEVLAGTPEFTRKASVFRNWVTADGSAGPSGRAGFKAEPGRYHLYVSLACPWAHRTLIMRALKGLREIIGVSVVNWLMLQDGWTFEPCEGATGDQVNNVRFLRDLYTLAEPFCTSRVTVPVLWDVAGRTIVSNESSEIIRMLNSAFDGLGALPGDYYPPSLTSEIDALNARIYADLNNGVYRAGFARAQRAYEDAASAVFATLDDLEARLADGRRYLLGDALTEADIRLFTTLIRFDPVYHGHFKCNLRRLIDYPHLSAYARGLYQHPDIRPTVNFDHIKRHYYESHRMINPSGVVPIGPLLDYLTTD
jgi:putative glutathione S-transferase